VTKETKRMHARLRGSENAGLGKSKRGRKTSKSRRTLFSTKRPKGWISARPEEAPEG